MVPPVVTLAMARERALDNARTIARGRDPWRSAKPVPTFAQALDTVIAIHAPSWKDRAGSERQWRASLASYALPRIGGKSVDAVTAADVMDVLLPIWSTRRVTATRVPQRIGAVMKWGIAQGLRDDNPAGDAIADALPEDRRIAAPPSGRCPHAEVRAALDRVRHCDAYRGARLAFEFLVLTAARSGEVRHARWDEIDRDRAVWTVPRRTHEERPRSPQATAGPRRPAERHRPPRCPWAFPRSAGDVERPSRGRAVRRGATTMRKLLRFPPAR